MTPSQQEIIEVEFELPQGSEKHPAIILSNNNINQLEEGFVCAMMTTYEHNDEYSFVITKEMLLYPKAQPKHSEVRCHLINFFPYHKIILSRGSRSKLKMEYFKELLEQISATTFSIIEE